MKVLVSRDRGKTWTETDIMSGEVFDALQHSNEYRTENAEVIFRRVGAQTRQG